MLQLFSTVLNTGFPNYYYGVRAESDGILGGKGGALISGFIDRFAPRDTAFPRASAAIPPTADAFCLRCRSGATSVGMVRSSSDHGAAAADAVVQSCSAASTSPLFC